MKNKKAKIIGFDLDCVLLDFHDALMAYHNRVYCDSFKMECPVNFAELQALWGGDAAKAENETVDFYESKEHMNARPIQGAIEGIEKLKKGNTLYVVTVRPDVSKEKTLAWIDKNFPDTFSGVYFTNEFHGGGIVSTKARVSKELGIEVFVDDSLERAREISEAGIPVLLLDTPWNHEKVSGLITRVNSWAEIMEKLTK
ncbi:MAG: hypothetical protein WCX27_00820 [Candidatus Paceibacterota bacterium]|jgi:uncharacterized HAD superfamily protein